MINKAVNHFSIFVVLLITGTSPFPQNKQVSFTGKWYSYTLGYVIIEWLRKNYPFKYKYEAYLNISRK